MFVDVLTQVDDSTQIIFRFSHQLIVFVPGHRNVYGTQGDKKNAAILTRYLRRELASLAMTDGEAVLKGESWSEDGSPVRRASIKFSVLYIVNTLWSIADIRQADI